MSTTEQHGKDPENGEEIPNLRKLYDDVLPSGRVIIAVIDQARKDHYVVVPIPKSYEAAMTIVFDQLGGHIPTSGGRPLLEGAYFKYWMRSPGGVDVWAKLPPEFWKEIVKDGDIIKLCFPQGEQPATFILVDKYGSKKAWVIVPIPKSYEEAVRVALRNFESYGSTRLQPELCFNRLSDIILDQKNWMRYFGSVDFPVEIEVRK